MLRQWPIALIPVTFLGSIPAEPFAASLEHRELISSTGETIQAEFGTLQVPENRKRSDSRMIQLRFVRLKSRGRDTASPLVFLAGGPGDAATQQALNPDALEYWLRFLDVSDVILFDQRGCGRSEPSLRWSWDGPPPLNVFTTEDAAAAHWREMSRRARADLVRQGIDLDGYTTMQMVDDVDSLRTALNEERISLFGFSFGTHVSLAIMRKYPQHIESVILAGVAGPDHLLRLPKLADMHIETLAELADRDRRVRVEDLSLALRRALTKLENQPMTVQVMDPQANHAIELLIGPFGLRWLLARDLGDTTDVVAFPRLLDSILQDDPSVLQWFVQKRYPFFNRIDGLMMMVRSSSGGSKARRAEIASQAESSLFGNAVNFPFNAVNEWTAPDLGDNFRTPIYSNVRTLLVSGTLDWNTPVSQSEEVMQGLANASLLVVKNAGHEQLLSHPDVRTAMVDFLKGREVGNRILAYPAPQFLPTSGSVPGRSHPAVKKDRSVGWAVRASATFLGMVVLLLTVAWHLRRKKSRIIP